MNTVEDFNEGLRYSTNYYSDMLSESSEEKFDFLTFREADKEAPAKNKIAKKNWQKFV